MDLLTGEKKGPSSDRLLSLDVFRGLTMAATIIVSTPGYDDSYRLVDHAKWHGCTFADLVFPFFIFIIGVSVTISLSKRIDRGDSEQAILAKIFKRAAILVGVGLLANGIFASRNLLSIRFSGVLQRLAICYFVGAWLFLKTKPRTQAWIGFVLVAGYWFAMSQIPVPGFGKGDFSKQGNLASFIDRALLGSHTYRKAYDPEGILSTFPAIGTCIIGLLAGHWLRSKRTSDEKTAGLAMAGIVAVAAGLAWNPWFPINKRIWTSSYVLFTGGLALILLAACYWTIEIKGWRSWTKPWEVIGLNSILAYILPILFWDISNLIPVSRVSGPPGNLRYWICDHLFGSWMSILNASLAYAVATMLVWMGIFWIFYRRKIFLRI